MAAHRSRRKLTLTEVVLTRHGAQVVHLSDRVQPGRLGGEELADLLSNSYSFDARLADLGYGRC